MYIWPLTYNCELIYLLFSQSPIHTFDGIRRAQKCLESLKKAEKYSNGRTTYSVGDAIWDSEKFNIIVVWCTYKPWLDPYDDASGTSEIECEIVNVMKEKRFFLYLINS